jgi:predicted dehydrogenase
MSRNKSRGVALIGFGAMGVTRAAALKKCKNARFTGCAETSHERRECFAAAYPETRCIADYRALLEDPGIDVVCVCAPFYKHRDIVVNCLEAGKHVIVENPVAGSVADSNTMISASQRTDKRFFVAHSNRFDPKLARIRELIRSDAIGTVFMGMASYIGNDFDRMNDPADWMGSSLSGGGVFVEACTRIIDSLRSFLGDAVWVSAAGWQGAVKLPNKGEDSAAAQLGFVSGAVVQMAATSSARWNDFPSNYSSSGIRYDFYGDRGSLHFSTGEPVVVINPEGRHVYRYPDGRRDIARDEIEHFLECIENGLRPIVTAHDAREALRIVEAAHASMKTGARVPIAAG